ncbi:hypothetical protein U27_05888 [Candidatus Vecturithrix granuli]|uniref:Uncharacterized protein n=1 Tax=Vecturithrix granuli TaxID=1499967 RepID=A0A081C2V8_VECG1|nr:hypothetical protein U27_05888 [Candidatus Vecturithrix granuli]
MSSKQKNDRLHPVPQEEQDITVAVGTKPGSKPPTCTCVGHVSRSSHYWHPN